MQRFSRLYLAMFVMPLASAGHRRGLVCCRCRMRRRRLGSCETTPPMPHQFSNIHRDTGRETSIRTWTARRLGNTASGLFCLSYGHRYRLNRRPPAALEKLRPAVSSPLQLAHLRLLELLECTVQLRQRRTICSRSAVRIGDRIVLAAWQIRREIAILDHLRKAAAETAPFASWQLCLAPLAWAPWRRRSLRRRGLHVGLQGSVHEVHDQLGQNSSENPRRSPRRWLAMSPTGCLQRQWRG